MRLTHYWFVDDIARWVIWHADTLIFLQRRVSLLTLKLAVYSFFGKNKGKVGQKCFASPKIYTPVHLCVAQRRKDRNFSRKCTTSLIRRQNHNGEVDDRSWCNGRRAITYGNPQKMMLCRMQVNHLIKRKQTTNTKTRYLKSISQGPIQAIVEWSCCL